MKNKLYKYYKNFLYKIGNKIYCILLYIIKREIKSSFILFISFILVTGSLLQLLSTSIFVDNEHALIKIPSSYAEEDGGDGGGDDGSGDASKFFGGSNEETNDDDSGDDDGGTGKMISNFFGGSNGETNEDSEEDEESTTPNFFGVANEETNDNEKNTNNEEDNIDNPNEDFPTTVTDENKGSGLITSPVQQEPTSNRCPDGSHRSPSGDCERVTDTSGMERCPDGSHRSPSGDCERVTDTPGKVLSIVQPDPTSNRCPDGYHKSPSGDCEKVTDNKGKPRCPDGSHTSPSGDCERVSDYTIGKGKYYHYYYDDNDDNDVKIIKKIYKRDNTCQTQSDSTQLKGKLPPKNVIILADFEPCKLKDGRSTLSIPNNPYLKFVVLSIDKKGNNHKGAMIDLEKVQNINKNNGLYLVNFDSKMSGENPLSEKKITVKKINGLALYNLSEKTIQFNTGNSLALTAVLKK